MRTSTETAVRRLTRFASSLLGVAAVAAVISLATPCAAQEVDTPTPPDTGGQRGGLIVPTPWIVLDTPVDKRVDVKAYGFYVGQVKAPVAQLDVPIKVARFFTVTPSYLYTSIPASGLNQMPLEPAHFTHTYNEHQFRVDGTFGFAFHKFEISVRNMYVRRFRPAPAGDINRYRGRISIARPVSVHGKTFKPFASFEEFHERPAGWNRNRLWTGVTVPVTRRASVQPSYLWEQSDGNRDIHYLLFALMIRTK